MTVMSGLEVFIVIGILDVAEMVPVPKKTTAPFAVAPRSILNISHK